MNDELDIRALRYFLAVAEYAGYSRAASALRITQPAISRQVQALERRLRTRLFRREGRAFLLTESGRILQQQAREIVEAIDRLPDQVGIAEREPAGRLSVGMPLAAGGSLLCGVLQEYRRRYPGVFLHVVQGYTSQLADALVAGKLDIAVLYGAPRRRELELTPLVRLELGLVAPAGPVQGIPDVPARRKTFRLQQLASLPLILPSRGEMLREVFDEAWRGLAMEPKVVMEVDSLSLAKELVQAGLGYTVLAHGAVHKEVLSGELRYYAIHTPRLPWPMSLARQKEAIPTLAMRAFAKEASESIRRGAREPGWNGELI